MVYENILMKSPNNIGFEILILFSFDRISLHKYPPKTKCELCTRDDCKNTSCIYYSNCNTRNLISSSKRNERKENQSNEILLRRKRDVTSPCSPNPCLNNGICNVNGNTFLCQCTSAFSGATCSVDVNECALNICVFSTSCVNTIGSYICTCIPGFQGVNCDTKINTCSPSPCQNNVMCYDMLNDYECLSSLTVNMFSGKTAAVPLTGCNTPNLCPTNFQCIPIFNVVQTYQCICNPGLAGATCTTNITFTLHSGMSYNKPITGLTDLNVSFAMETISPNGLIMVLYLNSINFFVGVDVFNHGIRITSPNTANMVIPSGSVTMSPTQYVPYRILMSVRTISGFNVFCIYVRVGTLPQGYYCSLIQTNTMTGSLYLNQHNDLQVTAILSQSFSLIPSMEACVIDYTVNSAVDILTTYNAGLACNGPLATCTATSCSLNVNRGAQCVQYWLTYTCICNRLYFGPNCEYEIKNLTLSSGSYMQLSYPLQFQQDLNNKFQLSFFFITSSPNAVIFYIGSFYDPINQYGALFLSGELVNGYINIKSKLSGSIVAQNLAFSSSLSWQVNDGLPRFISISMANNAVTVTITLFGSSRNVIALTVTNTLTFTNNFVPPLMASLTQICIIAFGFPPTQVASASQVVNTISGSLPPQAFSSTSSSFVGVVQDIQWNGFMTNIASQSNMPSTALLPIASQGLVTVNINLPLCSPNPCQNGATCSVQNYNQRSCACNSIFFGPLCQYNNLCNGTNLCSSSTSCLPRSDGYDCSKIFSIINNNQSISLSVINQQTQLTSVSLRLRTRSVSANIVRIYTGTFTVTLATDGQGRLVGGYSSQLNFAFPMNVVSNQTITDALWHSVSFTFSPMNQIVVDQMINRASDYGVTQFGPIFGVSSIIFGDAQNSLLGCFDQPLIGQYLLVTNETTSVGSALMVNGSMLPVITNCTGVNVCSPSPCQNNGTCIDNFNQYACLCTNYFTGQNCTVPTCLSLRPCTNNSLSACTQLCPGNAYCGPNEIRYGCPCINGWVGQTCNMVNPCIFGATTTSQNPLVVPSIPNNPCLNNGTCSFIVAEATNSSVFSCQCLSMWTGPTCAIPLPQFGAVIAGIVVAIIVLVLLILTMVWVWKAYKARKESGEYSAEDHINGSLDTPIIPQPPPAEKII